MKIIYNNIIPMKGYKAVNLLGVLFVRNGATLTDIDINHEAIHTAQMKETLYVGFYLWYALEWLVRLVCNGFKAHRAYRAVSFERGPMPTKTTCNIWQADGIILFWDT